MSGYTLTPYDLGNIQGAVVHTARRLGVLVEREQPYVAWDDKLTIPGIGEVYGVYWPQINMIEIASEHTAVEVKLTAVHEFAHWALQLRAGNDGAHSREWANTYTLAVKALWGKDLAELAVINTSLQYQLPIRRAI